MWIDPADEHEHPLDQKCAVAGTSDIEVPFRFRDAANTPERVHSILYQASVRGCRGCPSCSLQQRSSVCGRADVESAWRRFLTSLDSWPVTRMRLFGRSR